MRHRNALLAVVMLGSGAHAADWRTSDCIVEQLGIYPERVHIRCAKAQTLDAANQPTYFAVAAGTPMAAHLVSAISGYVTASQTMLMKGKLSTTVIADIGGGQQVTADKGDLYGSVGSPFKLRVRVDYDFADISGTKFGCLVANCRMPLSVEIH